MSADDFRPHARVLGPAGEPCGDCATPLAADQRYCLACGRRRGPARIDWRAPHSVAPAVPVPVPPFADPPQAPLPRLLADPARRAVAAGAIALFGLGVAGAALAGARPEATIAAARRVIVVHQPAPPVVAAAPAPAPEPAPAPAPAADAASGDPAPPADVATGGGDAAAPGPQQRVADAPATTVSAPSRSDTTAAETPPADTAPATPPVKHVWVVSLADHSFDEVLADGGPAPYLAGLRPKGLLLPGYAAVGPGPLANGVTLLSGEKATADQRGGCPTYTDVTCVLPPDVKTLPGQLGEAGRTWKGYVEGSDARPGEPSCRHPELGQPDPWTAPRPGDAYLTRRDPFVYFHALIDTPDCSAGITGPSRIAPDAADAESAPNFALVVPDACHDGRDQPCADGAPAGLGAADAWLKTVVDPILESKAYADGGAIVITFDQRADKPDGGTVGALVLSPLVAEGGTLEGAFTHADLLRTVEDLFALDPLGAGAKAEGFMRAFTARSR